MITLALADDHTLFRKSMAALLTGFFGKAASSGMLSKGPALLSKGGVTSRFRPPSFLTSRFSPPSFLSKGAGTFQGNPLYQGNSQVHSNRGTFQGNPLYQGNSRVPRGNNQVPRNSRVPRRNNQVLRNLGNVNRRNRNNNQVPRGNRNRNNNQVPRGNRNRNNQVPRNSGNSSTNRNRTNNSNLLSLLEKWGTALRVGQLNKNQYILLVQKKVATNTEKRFMNRRA
jgi:hypothetical protein